ncbi:hypothetical protein RhiJN_09886 [Ceratobasidium sp. AG-Ba]|nr:hypothetical protein RhiJN_09886 [Ceratobasidium sp. AG-Ba]QRW10643.1 hypothetical protein RhiLY_09642 [Ceratobasidium sp. AG-Ba]
MDFLNKLGGQAQGQQGQPAQQQQGGGGIMGMMNNMAGGGQSGEAKEDGLDKAVDWVQQNYLGGGDVTPFLCDQSNESALEQAKDEQISDMIRQQYKNMTGKDFPIADK